MCGLLALAGCGGGGGGASSGPAPTLTVDNAEVAVSARAGEAGPERLITLTIDHMPNAPVYGGVSGSNNGLASTTFLPGSGNTATVRLSFKAPAQLAPGSYTDTVRVDACLDAYCDRPIAGSPLTVHTTLVSPTSMRADPSACLMNRGVMVTGRNWSAARPSLRMVLPLR